MENSGLTQILGNLLYYPNSPERLIFFSTLSDKDRYNISRGELYHQNAQRIYKQGMQHLTNNTLTTTGFLKKGSDDYNKKIEYIENFLQQAIEYEKINELNYFKQKKDLISKIFTSEEISQDNNLTELIKFLQASSNNINNFDYETFIILINSLLQGKQFTQKVITYQRDRIEDLLTARDQAIDAIVKQLKEQNKVQQLSKSQERRYVQLAKKQIRVQYLQHKKLTDKDGNILGQTITSKLQPTIDVKFAEFINNCVNTVWENKAMHNKFKAEILQYYGSHSNKSIIVTESALKQILSDTILNYVGANMDKVIDSIFQSKTVQDVMTQTINQLQHDLLPKQIMVRNLPSHRFWYTEIAYFNQELAESQRAAGLFKIIDNFYRMVNRTKTADLTNQQKQTYFALGLSKKKINLPTRNAITFINNLQKMIKELRNQAKKLTKEDKTKGIEKVFHSKDDTDVKFIFTFDSHGRIKIPKDFLDYLNNRYDEATKILNIKNSNAKTLQTFLGASKQRMNREFKQRLDTIRNDKTKQQLLSTIHSSLKNIKMHISGPTTSELLAGLQLEKRGEELVLYWPGYRNNKNDFVSISIDFNQKQLTLELKDIFSQISNNRIKQFSNSIIKNKQHAALTWQKEFESEMQKQKKNNAGYHNYEAKKEAFFNTYDHFRDQSSKAINKLDQLYQETTKLTSDKKATQEQKKAQEQMRQKYEKLKNDLQHSFYRSDTMKSYNEYQGNIGFVGGSIGTNLQEQLNSIAMIFDIAGARIEKDELSLLYDLILNTNRNTIIGTKYRRTIETYLGAVAAFMLFDEGGAEVQILREKITETYTRTNNPDILHLYRLNGIYFPGSFILSETLRGVQELNTALNKLEHPNNGATIRITNTVSAADLPKAGTDPDPWRTIAKRVTENENIIQITFLAGMINILNNLQTKMSKIVIP